MNIIYNIQGIFAQISAQIVVSARNPIHRIASQVVLFQIGAFIFMIQDYYFQGQTYIIVYVGAIAILFLFVIMMVQIPLVSSQTQLSFSPKLLISSSIPNITSNQTKIIEINTIKKEDEYQPLLFTPTIGERNIENDSNNISTMSIIQQFKNKNIFIGIGQIFIIQFTNIVFGTNLEIENIYTFIYPEWAIEYKSMTDIETLGYIVYIGYPIAQILIAQTLWAVLIGIISISTTKLKRRWGKN